MMAAPVTIEPDRPGTEPDATRAEEGPSALDPGHVSAFLAELARAPDRDPEAALRALRPGAVVGKFELVREIGRGGFGVVFEAIDRELSRRVAFKAVRPGRRAPAAPGAVATEDAWLRREAEAAAQLAHPNIVTLHDLGTSEDGPYLVLELLRGETVDERLRRGPLAVREAVRISIEVARALAHAHAAGVLHRDLKPQNVFLCDDGGVKVLDFGLAHVLGTAPRRGGGTPGYMAPEQWRGEEEDERTDLFAAAVLLHEMLSGELPYPVAAGRSAALDPGPSPVLRRPGVPRALSSLVASGLSKDPAGRPRNAQVWLDGLFTAERALARPLSRRARLLRAGAAVLAAAAAAAGAYLVLRPAPEPGERIAVSVADFANDTDERDLSGLSGMLVTSLEQSRRLAVMTRSRMFDVLKQLGHDPVERIDEPLAREIGRRAGVHALLLASIRRFDRVYSIELRALDPARDEYLFTLREEGEGKAGIPAMIDRLSERTRRALRERPPEIHGSKVKVAEVTTPNLEAYQHYFLGQECMDRPSRTGSWTSQRDCAEEFRRALALDPAFALAHYQLAFLASVEHRPSAERDAEMRAALRHIDRAPPKEQLLIRAWNAHLDDRDDEALLLYRKVIDSYPDQKQALYLAGDVLYHRDDLAAAVPYLEKVLELDPYFEWPLDHLAQALGALRLREQLSERVRQWRALQATPPVLHALVVAQVWLGAQEGAVATAREAVAAGGGPAAGEDLVRACLFADRLAEAEAELRKDAAPGAPLRPLAYANLANVLATQGRRAEGRKVLDALASRLGPEPGDVAPLLYLRLVYDAGDDAPAQLWKEAGRLAAADPGRAADAAVFLAYLGDLEHAAALSGALPPGSSTAETYAAVVAWKKGDAVGAMARLRALDARSPLPRGVLPPSFLLAEVAASTGRDREAVEALRRYQSLWPLGPSRSWAYPRSILLVSRSLERLGERERALREVDRLPALWRHADRGLGLLREARELRARLVRAMGVDLPAERRSK